MIMFAFKKYESTQDPIWSVSSRMVYISMVALSAVIVCLADATTS